MWLLGKGEGAVSAVVREMEEEVAMRGRAPDPVRGEGRIKLGRERSTTTG